MTAPTSPLVEQVTNLASDVKDLQTTAVTYTAGVVTYVDNVGMTFAANVPQPDGTFVNVMGIGVSSPQFLPVVGQTVTLALSGAQLIYQPVGITPGSIGLGQTSTDGPGVPGGLTVGTAIAVNADGTTGATLTASWTAPTTSLTGGPVTEAPTYVLSYKPTAATAWTERVATSTTTTAPVTSGTAYNVRVASVDRLGNRSAWSATVTVTAGADTTAPGAPSTPVVSNYLGQLKVTWNGLPLSGSLPTDFLLVEVHVSTTSGFTPAASTLVADMSTGGSIFVDAPYGQLMYAKLIAVDLSGNKSQPSAQASGSTDQVVSADILAGAVDAAKLADLAVTTRAITDGAVGTSKIASLAVTSAQIADLAVGTAKMADLSVASAKIADAAIVTAKIGDLAVNNAKIGSMDVGKLTAGTLSAAVVLGNRITTALTGARTELNNVGFQKFDASNNLVVNITGSTSTPTLISGEYKTALSGRRIEIGASGAYGEIEFWSPANSRGFVRAFTEGTNLESIQIGMDTGGHALWNRININTTEYMSLHSKQVDIHFIKPSNGGWFFVRQYDTKASFSTGSFVRLQIDDSYFYRDSNNVTRHDMTAGGMGFRRPNGALFISAVEGAPDNRIAFSPLGPGTGGIDVLDYGGLSPQSARFDFVQADGGGVIMKTYGSVVEIRNRGDNGFNHIRPQDVDAQGVVKAQGVVLTSDRRTKENVTDATIDGVALLKSMRVRSYTQRRRRPGSIDPTDMQDVTQIGLIAQEAPPVIVAPTPGADDLLGIDIYQAWTVQTAAMQQLIARVETLEQRRPTP